MGQVGEQAGSAAPLGENLVSKRSRRRDWIEIAIGYGLIMAVVWTPRPWQRFLWVAAAAAIVVMMGAGFDGWKAVGLRAANFWRSLWIAGAALVLAGAAVLVAAGMHTLALPAGPLAFVGTYCAYAIWTGVQQFLLQGFFLLRLLRVMRSAPVAALVAAVLFATAHLPNPVLTPVTLIWGFVACLLFLRYRNLYPLMMAHAILGITVAITVPGPVVHNMRVGLGYLTYNPHRHGHQMHRLP
jgi:membrane protease YdiL (CAAX protease family)